ncbi:GNAT family N-acetyltransferase [Nocardioides pocheonensis]|uniref:GNAT family N-acetyltransferase n=1 Tax=Nocardioides pocheonensis TaxID=661485 RepID=A0A3N0GUL1_9ACTN|nr:GNAT family N-acetyltransferase [Nocardioides pocheonensis]RNM15800.1 GNAT family N-acetyltransferase [Nocardioides pocheonensis]
MSERETQREDAPDLPGLPDGFAHRPLTTADAAAVFEVVAAEQQQVLGKVDLEEADLVADWSRPSHDLASHSVGVLDGERIIAYAEVMGPARGDAAVHPGHHGRGVGTWLARWMQDRARALGHQDIGMPVPVGSPGEALLRALGYRVRWNSWVLVFPDDHRLVEQPLPTGHTIRVAESDADRRAAHDVIEDAFLEWSVREKQSYDDWIAQVVGRPGFEPWNLRVVVDPGGEVVGGLHIVLSGDTGFVSKVAVRRDRRGRGLAKALLMDGFGVARRHGATRSELSTDSRTGALDLYLGLGMEITDHWVNLGIALDQG